MAGSFHYVARAKQVSLLAVLFLSWLVPTAAVARCYNPAAIADRFEELLKEEQALTEKTAYTAFLQDGSGMQIGLLRWYDPNLQRWLNRDPAGEAGGINLYGFVLNDPINNFDTDGRWIGTSLFKIYRLWRESGAIKRELVHEIANKNLRESLKEMKGTLDGIDPSRYRRVVEAENGVSAEGIAEKLSKNKQCRGPEQTPPYRKHYNPEEGPYKDVHVEPGFSNFAAMALIPHAYEASNTEGITPGEFGATAAWDLLNGLDPVGVTDLMEWLFIK